MAEGKTSMFGKTYNTIGSTDSNFIIKTKGDLKVQWGNKYIDVIKNGKIASKDSNLLKLVISKDDIKGDGIYVLEDGTVCISIGDTIVDLLGNTGTTYVSFVEELQTTSEQKYLALLNIGFIYNTLKEAEEASLHSGIIYVTEKNKLYVIINGKLLEYLVTSEPEVDLKEDKEDVLTELVIGDLRIYNDAGYSKFNSSTRILLLLNGNPYISLELDLVKIHKSLVIDNGFYIQSTDASSEKGFRLYQDNNKSTLEVDNIIWRNIDKQLPTNKLTEGIIYSKYDNVVSDIVLEELTEPIEDTIPLYVYFKYKNLYKTGLFIYFYPKTLLIVKLEQIADKITVFLENSRTCEEDITVLVTYNDTETISLTIPAGINSVESSLVYTIINGIAIVNAPDGVITQDDLNSKNTKYEFEIIDSLDDYIIISAPIELLDAIIATSFDSLTHLSRDPYIEVIDNNILILDRSKKVIVEEEELPDETIHTNIGIIKEDEIESLTKCPTEESDIKALEEYESSIQVGIYSDNFIGLNSKLYNPVFKKRCDELYPAYDELLTIPEDTLACDKKFNLVVPDMEWIKRMMDFFFPVGTIIMFNGLSEIPPGWKICDGSNGTPDLIGKFIKAGTNTLDNQPEGVTKEDGWYKFQIQENHLPYHQHPQLSHVHGISTMSGYTDSSGTLTVSGSALIGSNGADAVTSVSGEGVSSSTGYSGDNTYGGTVTSYGGDHSHSVTINGGLTNEAISYDDTKNWPNNKITIEPYSYSLIFIMKTEPFVDYINNN